jgi:hypothetical protein
MAIATRTAAVVTTNGSTCRSACARFYLVEGMDDGALKHRLKQCEAGPFYTSRFSISHRGAPLEFPEHSRESYEAARRMGAGIIECDVTFTRDGELVCRHSECDLHTDDEYRRDAAEQCLHGALDQGRPGAEVLHQRHHAVRVQEPQGEDGRQQPVRDHGGGLPGRHAGVAHRSVHRPPGRQRR